ncbi:MAG: MBL fold metallo-hydrolase [Deltaproteobacteria bacterium]|nr:MAG: MBL fold metallo-hydrolase [Deltaproteobacteria bacterium]
MYFEEWRRIKPVMMMFFWCLLVTACSGQPGSDKGKVVVKSNPDLKAHSKEFKKEVIRVADGVYVAIGYGLANSILLEGDDGVVIVDTMESEEAAKPVKEAFLQITQKPVKTIIYTHFHPDHVFGTTIMSGTDSPEIISHEITLSHLDRIVSVTRETTYTRATRQFGTMLPEGGVINCGIGPYLDFREHNTVGLIRPTRTFSGNQLKITIAGMNLELYHAPGETSDQIFIWLPDKKVLLSADNFYRSFPNLYAIRGTAYRDVILWVKSLDQMRHLKPEVLVPSHTRPLYGAKEIEEALTNYRDAIQFVHDQTIRWINKGLTPDEIVERVKLPDHLAGQPYLHEYYGTVEWSVRAIFDGYLGWFSGNATDLFPLRPIERAKKMAQLAGGESRLLENAALACRQGEYQWALEICDHVLHLDTGNQQAKEIKADALTALGEKQIASTARNYYLTQALGLKGDITSAQRKTKEIELVHSIPLAAIFNGMAVRLDPVKSADVDQVVGFRFPDTGEAYTLHVRKGVVELQPWFPENPDIAVTVDAVVWKEIAAKIRNPAMALLKGDIAIEGGTFDLVGFLRLFET